MSGGEGMNRFQSVRSEAAKNRYSGAQEFWRFENARRPVAYAMAVVIAIAIISAAKPVFAASAAACAASTSYLPPYDRDPQAEPPTVGGKPIMVSVSLHVINISKIDDSAQHFSMDAYLFARWIDPRLAFKPTGPDDQLRVYKIGDIWIPRLEILNASEPRSKHDESITVGPRGDVTYAERFFAILSARFDLRKYPFDRQELGVYVHPFTTDANQIVFTLANSGVWKASEFEEYSSLAQWNLGMLRPRISVHPVPGGGTISGVVFPIVAARRYTFYLWKVFLPLVLMVFVSWGVMWIEPADLASQVQVVVTTILTVIAFAFAISTSMPRVSYLTYIDAFFLECYVFVFLAFVEIMIVHVTHRSDKRRDLGFKIRN